MMVGFQQLPEVDRAAEYLRNNSSVFVRKRLEDMLGGETVSGAFRKRAKQMILRFGYQDLEEKIYPVFQDEVLFPFIQICGFQIKTAPEADISVYTVFGQWWSVAEQSHSLAANSEDDNCERMYTFSDVMKLLSRGLDYHPESAQLHLLIAENYYRELDRAFSRREWGRVLTYSKVGDHYYQKVLSLDSTMESRGMKKAHDLKEEKVAAVKKILECDGY